ncbi:MAG: tetratricopeptide (TPR) repeat protein [Cellvibrionaceae bacterium]|jgi:tetratricopeptide (TPR) repeat protein
MNSNINPTPKISNSIAISDAQTQRICEAAEVLYHSQNYDAALRLFYEAWLTLPKPQMQQQSSEIILSLIGNTYYQLAKYEPAIEAFRSALACQQTDRRAFVLLRLGQALFDSNEDTQARTYLQKAYRLGGARLFELEENKYLNIIRGLI